MINPKIQALAKNTFLRFLGLVSFVAGFSLSVVSVWIGPNAAWVSATLVVIGLIVGVLNITGSEVIPFLIAVIALIVIGQGNIFQPLNDVANGFGTTLDSIIDKIALFAAPAGIVNAVRAAVALARPGPTM